MRTSRLASLARLAAGLFFVGFVVGQSPHLVHHLFEAADQTECAFALAGERLPGLAAAVEAPAAAHTWQSADPAARPVALVIRALIPAGPRAPPPLAS